MICLTLKSTKSTKSKLIYRLAGHCDCDRGEREPFNGLTLFSCHVVALEIDGDSMTVLHRCCLGQPQQTAQPPRRPLRLQRLHYDSVLGHEMAALAGERQ